jgi:hypothetical protein
MTSAIITSNIDGAFPVAGQDNNSQGFRDNFTNIKSALDTAGSEITTLQTYTAKVGNPDGTDVTNDFFGNKIVNAEYNEFYGSVFTVNGVSTTTPIDITNGPLQIVTFNGNATITFSNWPDGGLYAKIRLHLKSLTGDTRTVTFGNETGGGGAIKTIDGEFAIPSTSPQITVNNTTDTIVEAWTYNGGTDVYLKLVGAFE